METLAMFLLKAAGEAIVGVAVTSAGRRGLSTLRPLLTRLQEAKRGGDTVVVEAAQTDVANYLSGHPDQAEILVHDFLRPPPEAGLEAGRAGSEEPLMALIEGYLAALFVMVSQSPPGVLAVPGSLCGKESLTVIDTRPEGNMALPRRYNDYAFLLLDAYSPSSFAPTPRMWIGRPRPRDSVTESVRELSLAFSSPTEAPAGNLARMDRLSAATLAKLSGWGADSVRQFGRISVVRELSVDLDTETANEQAMTPPPSLEDRVLKLFHASAAEQDDSPEPSARTDYSLLKKRVTAEQVAAGLDHEFLQISGEGMRHLARSVSDRYKNAQRIKNDLTNRTIRQQEGIRDAARDTLQQDEESRSVDGTAATRSTGVEPANE